MARGRRRDAAMLVGVVRYVSSALLVSTALQSVALPLSFPASAQPAPNARPMGGAVVAGSAAISRSANNTQDHAIEPAGGDRLAELRRRQPAERHLRPALGQRGGAEPCHRTRPLADRRPHRRQWPDRAGQPVGGEFLSGCPGQRRGRHGQRRRDQQSALHGRAHGVRPAGPSPTPRSAMPARSR